MRVSIKKLTASMRAALTKKGFAGGDVDFLIEMYLGGELRGHTSHGLASFPGFVNDDWSKLKKPVVMIETGSLFMIDAKSNPGAIVGKRCADEAINRAKSGVFGTAIIKNMDSWLRPGAIAQYIANQGFFTVVINDGGGASVSPPGGYDPVLATNPIAYGIPTAGEPLVVDMATSKHAWGQVRLANKYGSDLPADSFYDDKGEVTRDPKQAHSVMPAGGYKGFALGVLIEIMCGSLVGMDNMMLNTHNAGSEYGVKMENRGGFILVIDPRQTAEGYDFKAANSELIEKIKNSHALTGETIRIPGENAARLQNERLEADNIELPDELWNEINKL